MITEHFAAKGWQDSADIDSVCPPSSIFISYCKNASLFCLNISTIACPHHVAMQAWVGKLPNKPPPITSRCILLSSTYTNNRSYVNMFLCIGICRHRMRTHIHIHASIHISIDIHIYICMHTHIRTCRYVHVCLLHLAHTNNRLKEGASPMHLWHAKHAVHVYAFPHAPMWWQLTTYLPMPCH